MNSFANGKADAVKILERLGEIRWIGGLADQPYPAS